MENSNLASCSKTLHLKIEYSRKRLLMLGNQLGLTHEDTIQNSQELDELINEYFRSNLKES